MTSINFTQALQENSSISNLDYLDNSKRVELNHSLWQRIIHWKEKNRLDNKISGEIFTFFKDRYGFGDDNEAFKRIWNKLGSKIWTPKKDLTAGILRNIDAKFRSELIYHGPGIQKPRDQIHLDKTVQYFVQSLLHGHKFSSHVIDKSIAKAIFITHDEKLMEKFRQELQLELNNLALNPPKKSDEEVVWRAFLGNVIALLPFSYPSTGHNFMIPVLENNTCRLVKYEVEVLKLTYPTLASPMTALGMTSKEDLKAPPILSFIGTTFPAGSGFAATLLADFTPGHSVGQLIYKRNKKHVEKWLKDKENVHVLGMSLGGAMAFHALRYNHKNKKITRLDAYNPPGLYSGNWKTGIGNTCSVNIYCQPGDTVSKQGIWPTGDNVSLYTVYPHQKGISEGTISSHARAFTGCKKITITKGNPKKENRSISRHILTKMHQFFGPFVVFLPIYCTILLYKVANVIHKVCLHAFKKISKQFKPRS